MCWDRNMYIVKEKLWNTCLKYDDVTVSTPIHMCVRTVLWSWSANAKTFNCFYVYSVSAITADCFSQELTNCTIETRKFIEAYHLILSQKCNDLNYWLGESTTSAHAPTQGGSYMTTTTPHWRSTGNPYLLRTTTFRAKMYDNKGNEIHAKPHHSGNGSDHRMEVTNSVLVMLLISTWMSTKFNVSS
jgi:hypothetical protein